VVISYCLSKYLAANFERSSRCLHLGYSFQNTLDLFKNVLARISGLEYLDSKKNKTIPSSFIYCTQETRESKLELVSDDMKFHSLRERTKFKSKH
jgi:hypothetical protein